MLTLVVFFRTIGLVGWARATFDAPVMSPCEWRTGETVTEMALRAHPSRPARSRNVRSAQSPGRPCDDPPRPTRRLSNLEDEALSVLANGLVWRM